MEAAGNERKLKKRKSIFQVVGEISIFRHINGFGIQYTA